MTLNPLLISDFNLIPLSWILLFITNNYARFLFQFYKSTKKTTPVAKVRQIDIT